MTDANTTSDDRYENGRRHLLEIDGGAGEQVVDTLGDLGRYIVEFAFGDVYDRPACRRATVSWRPSPC
jgi:4-carboxymuconolactone decarboxylase